MSYLLVGDLHLTDRAQDAYRFEIFEVIRKWQIAYNVTHTFFMGDITDSKDKHSAILVNSLIDGLSKLRPPIFILKGNHDFIDPRNPYFAFLNDVGGITFIVNPLRTDDGITFLPFIRDEVAFSKVCNTLDSSCRIVLAHNTFSGAINESGKPLTGFNTKPIERLKPAWGTFAGDVHRPQQAGPVTYVGAPYHIKFGDDFEPRCILLDKTGKQQNLYPNFLRKWKLTINGPNELAENPNIAPGDQIKVVLRIPMEDKTNWVARKSEVLDTCKKLQVECFGVELDVIAKVQSSNSFRTVGTNGFSSKKMVLQDFCKREKQGVRIREAGKAFLDV